MFKSKRLVATVAAALLVGCDSGQIGNREAGALTGGALGAGLGAIVGNQTGNTGAGIAIGAASGALAGGLIGDAQDSHEDKVAAQEELLRRQEEELERQRREIEDLKRQKYHNDSFRRYDQVPEEKGSDSFSY